MYRGSLTAAIGQPIFHRERQHRFGLRISGPSNRAGIAAGQISGSRISPAHGRSWVVSCRLNFWPLTEAILISIGRAGVVSVDHNLLTYPVLICGEDYAYLAKTKKDLERTPKSQFDRLRDQARRGKVQLLDSNGMAYSVTDRIVTSTQNFLLKWFTEFRTAPVLSNGRQLELSEFKRKLEAAIWARQKGDFDCDFIGELKRALPSATSFREAMGCVPQGM